MEYLKFSIIISISILCFLIIFMAVFTFYRQQRKKDFIFAFLWPYLSKHAKTYEGQIFFSSSMAYICAQKLAKMPTKQIFALLDEVETNGWKPIYQTLRKENKRFALVFLSFFRPRAVFNILQKEIAKKYVCTSYLLLAGILFAQQNNMEKLKSVLNRLRFRMMRFHERVPYFLIRAHYDTLTGNLSAAIKKLERVVNLSKRKWQFFERSRALFLIAELYNLCRQFDNAYLLYNHAEDIAAKIDNSQGIAWARWGKGKIFAQCGDAVKASEALTYALDIFTADNITLGQVRSINQLALLKTKLNQFDQAKELLNQAKTLNKKLNNPSEKASTLDISTYFYYLKKEYGRGMQSANRALKIYKKLNNQSGILNMKFLKALMLTELTKYEIAQSLCQKILKDYISFQVFFSKSDVYSLLARICFQAQQYNEAIKWGRFSLEEDLYQHNINGAFESCHYLLLTAQKLKNKDAIAEFEALEQKFITEIELSEKQNDIR